MVFVFFFFQAEDGIRDSSVTGVQTCALPISVVRLGEQGYRVRLVRDVGVTAARWTEVGEAVTTTTPRGLAVVELRLGDGRTTTLPVALLDVDREQFVRDLQGHLQRGQGLRPLD